MAVYYNRMFYRATPAVVSHWVYVKFKYSHNKILRTTNWDKPYLFQEYANIFKCVESISVAFFTLELFLTVIASGNGCRISPAQKDFHIHWLDIRLRWETEQWYENPPQLLSFDIVTDFLAVFPFYFEFLIRMALRTAWIIYNLLFRQVVYCSLRIYCFIPMCEDF